MTNFDPIEHRIFECIAGSHLYGTNTPESDKDYRGVCLPPMNVLLDPFMGFEVKDSGFDETDRSIYSLAKFMNLCLKPNPNIIELLFVPEKFIVYKTLKWDKIAQNRKLFITKEVKKTFLGYALGQLKDIKRHREWFIDPPNHKPTREEFNLPAVPVVSIAWIVSVGKSINDAIRSDFRDELEREKEYFLAKKKWDNYHMWQTNRNPARKGTEEKFGYDTKYASHLFRLMEEAMELLLDGEIRFPLHNADWLLEVKNGLYSYERMLELVGDLELKFGEWYNKSILPDKPNVNKVKKLYFEILDV